ncbi:hypothetical protein KCMC57_up13630 [Kitasatospora sp. CMC57]|uniref:Secreted protein n=1 Tax=Kitasatospora sp. CMC57 TaxID=3231513 RepID=A0AB33JQD1_9ACTN
MHPERRRHRAHLRVLLVLATLLGVLAMHGLGAGPVLAAPPPVGMSAEHQHHGGGDGHAGPMCLSGAVAAPFVPAPPGPAAPYGCGVTAPEPLAATSGEPDGGRAPPSLAELQLVRR